MDIDPWLASRYAGVERNDDSLLPQGRTIGAHSPGIHETRGSRRNVHEVLSTIEDDHRRSRRRRRVWRTVAVAGLVLASLGAWWLTRG